jgi:hypothetical protein
MKRPDSLAFAVTCVLAAAVTAPAQIITGPLPTSPPGEVGTIGLDGTVEQFYSVTRTAIVKTADGARHVVHFLTGTAMHGAKAASQQGFGGLEEGSRVVVHYVADGEKKTAMEVDRVGDGGLSLVEGTVRHVDRQARQLTIALADGTVATLRLTNRAAEHVGKGIRQEDRVIVYYADEAGENVAHFFKLAE